MRKKCNWQMQDQEVHGFLLRFFLEQKMIDMVKANFNFTMDLMATYKNRLAEKYYSSTWEAESAGKNFFLQKVDTQDFRWYFPPPGIFWQD